MGMFDRVTTDVECSSCGSNDWGTVGLQSKDGNCELQDLTLDELIVQSDDDRAYFYGTCDKCGTWNEWKAVIQPHIGVYRVMGR